VEKKLTKLSTKFIDEAKKNIKESKKLAKKRPSEAPVFQVLFGAVSSSNSL
jgi:hypothetical protein